MGHAGAPPAGPVQVWYAEAAANRENPAMGGGVYDFVAGGRGGGYWAVLQAVSIDCKEKGTFCSLRYMLCTGWCHIMCMPPSESFYDVYDTIREMAYSQGGGVHLHRM